MIGKELRHAIIGTGAIAVGKHIPGYLSLADQDVQIAAVCDIDKAAVEAVAAKYGISNVYYDYKELLRDPEIDSVSICLPNHLHAPVAIEAMRASKHVHCEKPMALNADQATEMLKVRDETGMTLMIALNNRFLPASQFVKKYIAEGKLGEIYHAKCGWVRRNGLPASDWFAQRKLSGGGPLIDLGVHYLDLSLHLMGFPKILSVSAATHSKFGSTDRIIGGKSINHLREFSVEDLVAGFCRLEADRTLAFEFSWASNIEGERIYYELLGTDAGIKFEYEAARANYHVSNELFVTKVFKRESGQDINILPTINPNSGWRTEFAEFVSAIRQNCQPEGCRAEEGVQIMQLVDAVYQSASTHTEVNITTQSL